MQPLKKFATLLRNCHSSQVWQALQHCIVIAKQATDVLQHCIMTAMHAHNAQLRACAWHLQPRLIAERKP